MAKLVFNNPNAHQTLTSTSALHNNAAKDDIVTLSENNSFTLAELLANDPGSAIYESFSKEGTGTVDFDGTTFVVTGEITSFSYTIRLANGTYSTAQVTLNEHPCEPHLGSNLFTDNFNSYTVADPWANVSLSPTWNNLNGSNTEVCIVGYANTVGGDGGWWLDTQGSSGGVDISHVVNDANGGKAQITLSLAVQDFSGGSTSGDLQVTWNGHTTTIARADVEALGATGGFYDVVIYADSAVGDNTLEIRDTGVSFVGFALDSVRVDDWIVC